jgi:hypothetical protein
MNKNYSQLLIDVQKKANINITNVRDVKYLKEEIASFSDLEISFNTLRRLFGFLKKTKPSNATLNTLANYLEYRSYTNYLSYRGNFEEWYFQQKILLIQLSNDITEEDIYFINTGINYRDNIVTIAYFITILIQENKTILLNEIFGKLVLSKSSIENLLKFATIITHSFYRVSDSKALIIYNSLMKHESFRNSVPLLYIDYSNLNTLYSKVLGLVEVHSTKDSDLFFVLLMQFYKQFYTSDELNFEQIKQPINFSKFHPILKGRYFAHKIMTSNSVDETLKKVIFIECKTNKAYLIIEEVIPALIIKGEYEILSELSEKFYEDIFESYSWSNNTTNTIYLIALANISWSQNLPQVAKKNLALIELDKIELSYYDYISLFYYHTQLKISHLENDLKINMTAYSALRKIVLKTGFIKFLNITKMYILN